MQGGERGKDMARRLRADMSLPERLLWGRLKYRPLGAKFRRQHPAGRYVLDFYCHEARLVVEVDGIAHDMADRPERDRSRDAELAAKGLHVVRIAASDILADVDGIAQSIAQMASARSGEAS